MVVDAVLFDFVIDDAVCQPDVSGRLMDIALGVAQGIEQGIKQLISKKYKKNMDSSTIAEQLELEEDYVKQVIGLLENEEKI